MARPPEIRDDRDTAIVVLLVTLGIVTATTAVIWAGAALAAILTGHQIPAFSARSAWTALLNPRSLDDVWGVATPPMILVWACTVVIAAALAALTVFVLRAWRHTDVGGRRRPLHRTPGIATAADLRASASARALVRNARRLRPSLARPTARDVGFSFGSSHGIDVWTSVEDSTLVVGPSRSGKGVHVVIPAVLQAPGAAVSTSTRPDVINATLDARQRIGPVAVFDPQRLVPDISAGMRWSPVRGCDDPQTAMIRARGLAAGAKIGKGVENGDFWESQTEAVLRCLLHAAALGGHDARDLYRWSLDPIAAMQAHRILTTSADAADGWAETLEAAATADPRTRDSIWLGVRQAFAALADPRVLAAVTPSDSDTFAPAAFIRDQGTLYVLGTASGATNAGSLVAALIEDLAETARHLAARSPGARLDPPLTLVLDEIANLAPLPSLPALVSEGGGSGITTFTVLQTMAQARDTFGEHTATTIWDASAAKFILGGSANARDLQDLTTLIGDRDEHTISVTRSTRGEASRQTSIRRIPILEAGDIRSLPFGQAVLLHRSCPPVALTMRSHARTASDESG